jgi:hypothetical protein
MNFIQFNTKFGTSMTLKLLYILGTVTRVIMHSHLQSIVGIIYHIRGRNPTFLRIRCVLTAPHVNSRLFVIIGPRELSYNSIKESMAASLLKVVNTKGYDVFCITIIQRKPYICSMEVIQKLVTWRSSVQ